MTVLPPRLHRILFPSEATAAAAVNRSLIFDKSPEPRRAGRREEQAEKWKCSFYESFVANFRQYDAEYDSFIARRSEALDSLGARAVDLESTSRLIVGHGLSHSTQTGFLFDRLRGVPYLPGSTVKGLLRETSRLIAGGEIAADSDVRDVAARADEVFGTQTRRGAIVCEDAYALKWPRLELDVMTPHHQQYYENGTAPGDWESPIPVYFLTMAPSQLYRFWFSGPAPDLVAVEKLLRLGLEWLGVGGKKSSGYGRFWPLDEPVAAHKPNVGRRAPAPPAVTRWPDAILTYTPNDGFVTARWQGKTARARNLALPDWFKKKKAATAAVEVQGFTIVSIDWPPK